MTISSVFTYPAQCVLVNVPDIVNQTATCCIKTAEGFVFCILCVDVLHCCYISIKHNWLTTRTNTISYNGEPKQGAEKGALFNKIHTLKSDGTYS
jgi:hypothetical protein